MNMQDNNNNDDEFEYVHPWGVNAGESDPTAMLGTMLLLMVFIVLPIVIAIVRFILG